MTFLFGSFILLLSHMLNVPVQVYIAIMVLHEDPLEDVQSLFCELVKNEEQEE